ncbi:hypothetical protein M3175_20520 [Robertmurraya korlensis]|uniref:hypothetical protein n=1 Tax=Robertmurraya korlensis TaxID=519977 RepID=UPI00203F77C4|nr:hypothetical protein [Robertmurraya korlensis]MCM3603127.1 hypothetical protein [Robertmurraya korlensis]
MSEQVQGKTSFWIRIAEHNLYDMCKEMGFTEDRFIKYQKKRFLRAILLGFPLILAALFTQWWWALAGVVISGFLWWNEYNRAKKFYGNFNFEKQLQYAKFTRMLIPYLLQTDATLYSVFTRLLDRLEDSHVKRALERLLIEMNEYPNSEIPFVRFAKDASGTDSSILFMTTLYDFQQNTYDQSIIMELGQLSSDQLFEGVDEIITYKLRKFALYPTKLTMSSFVITLGYAICMISEALSEGLF